MNLRFVLSIILSAGFWVPETRAQTQGCDYLIPVIETVNSKPTHFDDPIAVFNEQQKMKHAIESSLHLYYQQYRKEKLTKQANICFSENAVIPQLEATLWVQQMPIVFLNDTLDELTELKTPYAQKFLATVRSRLAEGNLLGIRLVGHIDNAGAPTADPAGFKRGDSSIFMNIDKIKGSDWLLVLVHELFHALDSKLAEGVDVFGSELSNQVEQLSKAKTTWSELSQSEQAQVDQFLMAGLERGYIAEVRAWAGTLKIYEEGLSVSFFKTIDWMKSLHDSHAPTVLKRIVNALDSRFYPETHWIFSKPLISLRRDYWRQMILQDPVFVGEIL